MARIHHNIDSFTIFHDVLTIEGWVFHEGSNNIADVCIENPEAGNHIRLLYGQNSQDVVSAFGAIATDCRFSFLGNSPFSTEETQNLRLKIQLTTGEILFQEGFIRECLLKEAVHGVFGNFLSTLSVMPAGNVLELGSRARSNISRKHLIPSNLNYIGADVMAGPNVDLVCDAHYLSQFLAPDSIDAVFSFSVFEHLLMPWKVAIELNKVMRIGAIGMIITHQAWPIHDAPCDFWRFSDQAWQGLFNKYTGFSIIESKMSDPAYLVSKIAFSDRLISQDPSTFLQSAVLFQKTSNTSLSWDIPSDVLVNSIYPI